MVDKSSGVCYNVYQRSLRRYQIMEKTAAHPAIHTKELVMTALMSVVIAVCSWLVIPAAVQFTMQTFAVYLAVLLLGGKNSFFSVVVYLMLGLTGVPVFSGFTGGPEILFGKTGGYLFGFLLIPLVYMIAERISVSGRAKQTAIAVAALVIGTILCYAVGTAWFIKVYTSTTESVSIRKALSWCVTPFILADSAKLAAAVLLSGRLMRYIKLSSK